MAESKNLTRRNFLKITAMAAVGALAASCAAPSEPTSAPAAPTSAPAAPTSAPAAPTATPQPASKYGESPLLAEMVKAGTLPPVDERLPEDVLVVDAGEGVLNPAMKTFEIGKYGGTMRYVTARTDLCAEMWDANCEPPFRAPGSLRAASLAELKPNLFKGFEISPDQNTITWHMRKGLKWSDGQPCTTADVKFWYEDVLLNTDITPIPGKIYKAGNRTDGEVMKLEVVDDYTFKTAMTTPNLALVEIRSRYSDNWHNLLRPAHYMKQFHKKYADAAALKKMLDDAKLPEAEWAKYYLQRDEGKLGWTVASSVDPNYPVLYPWKFEKESAGVRTWVRNPYYCKVDPQGNQLPYIDRLRIEFVSNAEAVTMKIIAGECDHAREYASMLNYSLYKENEAKGNFVAQMYPTFTAPLGLRFNFTHPDENWRKLVRDVRFRKALNMAVDHAKIVDTVFKGYGKGPELLGVSYDAKAASALLDEMGLDKKDSEGWRLGFDGKRLIFPLEVVQGYSPDQDSICTLLVEYWQDIGLKTDYRQVESTLYTTRNTNNELWVNMSWAHTGFWRSGPNTQDYQTTAARLWQMWNDSGGKEGEEPEAWAKRLYEIGNIADSYLMSAEDVSKLHAEMFALIKEQQPLVLPVDETMQLLVLSNKLANVPMEGIVTLASMTVEQWYFKS